MENFSSTQPLSMQQFLLYKLRFVIGANNDFCWIMSEDPTPISKKIEQALYHYLVFMVKSFGTLPRTFVKLGGNLAG